MGDGGKRWFSKRRIEYYSFDGMRPGYKISTYLKVGGFFL